MWKVIGAAGADITGEDFDEMVKCWGMKKVILDLARECWDERISIAKALLDTNTFKHKKDPIRTIATYYHSASNGGVERVNAGLIPMWLKMGYNVIFITDDPPGDDDYELPENLTRLLLPDFRTHKADMYYDRYTALSSIINDYNVDVFVFHYWISENAFWDMLTVKSCGCRFVMHCHNVFSMLLARNNPYFAEMPYIYEHFDAVLTLSKIDTAYWKSFNDKTYQMFNPLTFDLREVELSPLNSLDVLCLGRLVTEKNPIDTVSIIELVAQEIPDVKLHIVGKGEPHYSRIEDYIERNGLQRNVILHGFAIDVEKYYKNASVFLLTADYEGFCLTLLESKSYGVPCVCYEMPYLDFCQDGRGIVSVPHGDINAAAKEIVRLLRDSELRGRLGVEARASIEDYATIDIQKTWQKFFNNLEDNSLPTAPAEVTPEMFSALARTLGIHSKLLRTLQKANETTMREQRREIASLKERLSKASQAYAEKEENFREKIEVQKAKSDSIMQKKEEYKTMAENYRQKIADLKTREETHRQKAAEFKVKFETYKTKEETYKQRIADLKVKEESYKQKIAAHKTKEAAYIKHKQKLDAIYRSRSWKLARIISAPLRLIRRLVSRG